MTERIQLTEEILADLAKFLLHYDENISRERANYFVNLTQQILADHEKIELLTESELRDLPLLKVAGEQTLEIKQLKENATKREKEIGDLLHEKSILNQKLEQLTKECESHRGTGVMLSAENQKLKRKLTQVKQLVNRFSNLEIAEAIKKILGDINKKDGV